MNESEFDRWINAVLLDDLSTVKGLWGNRALNDEEGHEWLSYAIGHGGDRVWSWCLDPSGPRLSKELIFEAFVNATRRRDEQKMEALMASYDASMSGEHGNTPLMWAAAFGMTRAMAMMLAKGVDAGVENHDGETALFDAIRSGSVAAVEMLMPLSNLHRSNHAGDTPLMEAAAVGTVEIIQLLMPGSSVHATDANGNTLLMIAANFRSKEKVEFLMPLIDWSVKNKKGQDFLDLAKERFQYPFLSSILAYKAMVKDKKELSECIGQPLSSPPLRKAGL